MIGEERGGEGLLEDDFLETRSKANEVVKVPMEVIHLITDLRNWLQQKCEPPVYVSDRRMVKAIELMKASIYYICFTNSLCLGCCLL